MSCAYSYALTVSSVLCILMNTRLVPLQVYSLLGSLSRSPHFHNKDGYTFLSDQVYQLDSLNPSVAARMVKQFSNWKRCAYPHEMTLGMRLCLYLTYMLYDVDLMSPTNHSSDLLWNKS